MRYLKESELLPYIHAGKEIEQFLGEFYHEGFKCYRHITLGKTKDGYYALLFEKFDDSKEGIESIYDFSSVEPDDLYGEEIGPFDSFKKLLKAVNQIVKMNPNKYLMSGYLDKEIN